MTTPIIMSRFDTGATKRVNTTNITAEIAKLIALITIFSSRACRQFQYLPVLVWLNHIGRAGIGKQKSVCIYRIFIWSIIRNSKKRCGTKRFR